MPNEPDQYITAIAIKMLKRGEDVRLIMQATGLTLEEIQKLKVITT
jgi:hypothetical protein